MRVIGIFLLSAVMPVAAVAAEAAKKIDAPATVADKVSIKGSMEKCPAQEEVTINVTFNSREKTIRDAKNSFDSRVQEVENFARQAGVKKFTVTNMNYSINPQPQYGMNGVVVGITEYQLSGNVGYQLDNSETGVALVEQLARQNIQAALNVSSYRNQPCNMLE